jgi:DNA helicase II / ATP-dependent DNA helicase PcrA
VHIIARMNLSQYQKDILKAFAETNDNLIFSAVAGAGKTTMILKLAELVTKFPAVSCAFNAHSAKDLDTKLQAKGFQIAGKTIHSLGYACVRANIRTGKINNFKYRDIARKWIGQRRGFYSDSSVDWVSGLKDLLDYARLTLADFYNPAELSRMASIYDIDCDQRMLEAVPELLESGWTDSAILADSIDFTDMLWLPYVRGWTPQQFETMFVDECQDLNKLQAAFVASSLSPTGRIVFAGDPRQAIMAFGGADSGSYYNLKRRFNCVEMPLSFCYRCGKNIVAVARKYVSHILPNPEGHEGTVDAIKERDLLSTVQPGDAVLCRKTAPLIELCLNLIASGVPAQVRGRDMADRITSHVKKASKDLTDWPNQFVQALEDYRLREVNALIVKGLEEKIDTFSDTINCILAVYNPEKHTCPDDLIRAIQVLFTDETGGVLLSTIHRAKGLEWPRVFIYKPSFLPLRWANQSPEQAEQEVNLTYVGVTRAMHQLTYVEEA